jgi:hypothetical protein
MILLGGRRPFGDLDGVTGLVIGDLKPQELVDGRQRFLVLCGDPHPAAAVNVFIPIP